MTTDRKCAGCGHSIPTQPRGGYRVYSGQHGKNMRVLTNAPHIEAALEYAEKWNRERGVYGLQYRRGFPIARVFKLVPRGNRAHWVKTGLLKNDGTGFVAGKPRVNSIPQDYPDDLVPDFDANVFVRGS